MVRNGADRVTRALDGMQRFCDEVYAIDDRSVDETHQLLLQHPVVTNVFRVHPALSQQDWFFPESMGLNLLYRMADFSLPDWVIFLDDDQAIESPNELRTILAEVPSSVAALLTLLVSSDDPDYPLLVPRRCRATSVQGHIWRYFPGLASGSKPVHNGQLPVNIERFGRIGALTVSPSSMTGGIRFANGWRKWTSITRLILMANTTAAYCTTRGSCSGINAGP